MRDLFSPEPSLVHGNLHTSSLLWDGRGRLIGVLGWDLAQRFDSVLDAAWLLSQDWDPARVGVDREQLRRARIWALTLGSDPLARAILDRESESKEYLAYQVHRTVEWLERTTRWWSREALRRPRRGHRPVITPQTLPSAVQGRPIQRAGARTA